MAQNTPDFIHTGLPEWLTPPKTHVGPPYTEHQLEYILANLSEGRTYASLRREDPTLPTYGELLRWLRKHPELLKEYYESHENGTESLIEIGQGLIEGYEPDGSPCMDDVPMLKLRIDFIKWVAASRNAKRYGEKKQIDVTQKVDLSDALRIAEERAQRHRQRLTQGVTIDVTPDVFEELDPLDTIDTLDED